MKYVFTGCDNYLQPDLHRRLIIAPDFFSLTMDAFDARSGKMRLNGTVKCPRRNNKLDIERTANSSFTRYIVNSGYMSTKLHILAYDHLPYELATSLEVYCEEDGRYSHITGPTFKLDNTCRAAWRAFIDETLRSAQFDNLRAIADYIGIRNASTASVDLMAHFLTPAEVM